MRDGRFKTIHCGGPLTEDRHRLLAEWAANCADHVQHLFSNELPSDKRPSTAVRLAQSWSRGEISVGAARKAAFAAHDAARNAEDEAATLSARSAGHAVATAHMADHALKAAAYAIKAVASAGTQDDANEEYRWQQDQLPEEIRDLVSSAFREQHLSLVPDRELASPKNAG